MWNNEQFVKMASHAKEDVFPVVVEGMEKNLKFHWSNSVKQLTENVKEMLEGLEPSLYIKCLSQLQLQESAAQHKEMRRKEMWERVEMAANRNQCVLQLRCYNAFPIDENKSRKSSLPAAGTLVSIKPLETSKI